jgi:hypothetical protein
VREFGRDQRGAVERDDDGFPAEFKKAIRQTLENLGISPHILLLKRVAADEQPRSVFGHVLTVCERLSCGSGEVAKEWASAPE